MSYHYSMKTPQQLAIIGPTASGKTALALDLARQTHGVILSLDSLAIYRRIDIASAKPTPNERGSVPHFGINLIEPDMPFDVAKFSEEYRRAHQEARQLDVPLIVVGGSGFYLKVLLEGISPLPNISQELHRRVTTQLADLPRAHRALHKLDPLFADRIEMTDRYRIEKGLLIAGATGTSPTEYFRRNPPQPIAVDPLPLYEITVERARLRDRISLRTKKMLQEGLIDEVCSLEHRYTRSPNAMKSIGIKEVLSYLDGKYSYDQMQEKITTHTARLAKRQVTFNKGQFEKTTRGNLKELRQELLT
jgi:tRNA dimethylallyltransferase